MRPLMARQFPFDHHFLHFDDNRGNWTMSFNRGTDNESLLSSQFSLASNSAISSLLAGLPKDFVIINKGKKYYFANRVIRDISTVIHQLDSNIREYTINIDDPLDSMQKFVDVLNSKVAEIDLKTERPFFKRLAVDLNISIPSSITGGVRMNYFEPEINPNKTMSNLGLFAHSICSFFQNDPKHFTFIVEQKKYVCNFDCVTISKKIARELVRDNDLREYNYDIQDPNHFFQIICNYFNLEKCQLTSRNIDFIQEIATDLEIEPILAAIENHREKCSFGQSILNAVQDQIDLLTSLQDSLLDINELNYEDTISTLKTSIWLNNSERIKEFAANLWIACIYRTESQSLYLQLIKEISSAYPDFLSFFTNSILSFEKATKESRFIYQMHKEGIIPLDLIVDTIYAQIGVSNSRYLVDDSLFLFFLPEMDKKYPFLINNCDWSNSQSSFTKWDAFVKNKKQYQANDWQLYKQYRELGHNPDPFALAIYNDDVDKLQELLNTIQFNINYDIPTSLFENSKSVSLISYAAAHGSYQCFKFLSAYQATITPHTLDYAIQSGHSEIIHIAHQSLPEQWVVSSIGRNQIQPSRADNDNNHLQNVIQSSICFHRYGVLEWLITVINDQESLIAAIQNSIKTIFMSNNITSLMTIIDSGINLNYQGKFAADLQTFAIIAASRGFSDLLKIVYQLSNQTLNFVQNSIPNNTWGFQRPVERIGHFSKSINCFNVFEAASFFGSIRILRFLLQIRKGCPLNEVQISSAMSIAAQNGHLDLIKFWAETVFNLSNDNQSQAKLDDDNSSSQFSNSEDEIHFNETISTIQKYQVTLSSSTITKTLEQAAFNRHLDIIKYFENADKIDWLHILECAAESGALEIVKFIYENKINNSENRLNQAFNKAAQGGFINICQYLLDTGHLKLLKEDATSIFPTISQKGYLDVIQLVFTQIPKDDREQLTSKYLNLALDNEQESIALLFIHLTGFQYDTMILAAKKGFVSIVKYILENVKDPNYINHVKPIEGSVLGAAAINGSLELIDLLLQQKNLDKNLYNSKHETAIMLASRYNNFAAMRKIIDSYSEEEIQQQIWQVNAAFVLFFAIPPSIPPSLTDPIKAKNQNNRRRPTAFGVGLQDRNKLARENSQQADFDTLHYFLGFHGIDFNATFESITVLHSAIDFGKLECVSTLLQCPEIDVNKLDNNGQTPLMRSINRNHFRIMDLLLKCEKVDINFTSRNGDSALSCCANKSQDLLRSIIDSKNFQENHINTIVALFKFIKLFNSTRGQNPLFTLDFDINTKLDISPKYSYNLTCLEYACRLEPDPTLLASITTHPSFDPSKNDIVGCLFHIIHSNDPRPFMTLLPFVNDNVNLKNSQGESLLVQAVMFNASNIVSLILHHDNFDRNLSNFIFAFQLAMNMDNAVCHEFLNLGGFDINEPLFSAHPYDEQYERFYQYLFYDRQRNNSGSLRECMPNDRYEFEIPVQYPAEERQFFIEQGQLPLVASMSDISFFDSLISTEGLDINKKDAKGNPLIIELLHFSDPPELFFQLPNLDFNVQDNQGRTPLMHLIMSTLVHHGSLFSEACDKLDLTIKDNQGRTAYDYLVQYFPAAKNIPEPKDPHEFLSIYCDLASLARDNLSEFY